MHNTKSIAYTLFALIAFAANSVLCRLALGDDTIDAASFTVVRLLSSSLTLLIILNMTKRVNTSSDNIESKGSWVAALMLFTYAACFSFAYVSLDTATGALVLFGVVQITMILVSISTGNKLHIAEWLGVILAFGGFVYLVLPDVTSPSLSGLVMMIVAGIAWAVYTLKGKSSTAPLADTAYNFFRTTPLVILLALIAYPSIALSMQGVILAVLSGAIASGIGYTIWYIALNSLSSTEAAVLQLSVPVIAAIGGVILVNEMLTLRLVIAGIIILGGILLVVLGRYFMTTKVMNKTT